MKFATVFGSVLAFVLLIAFQNCGSFSGALPASASAASVSSELNQRVEADRAGASATSSVIDWTHLSSELQGFASETTGGLNGAEYVVTSADDYDPQVESPKAGTLRYALELVAVKGPTWIVFGPAFAKPQRIYLKARLHVPSNTTIDGRQRDVTLATRINWSLFVEVPHLNSRSECAVKAGAVYKNTSMLEIKNVQNVIVTNLKFTRENFPNPAFGSADKDMDKQCLGDIITVYDHLEAGELPVNNLWFNHLTIELCGDGCIDMVRPTLTTHLISISNSLFNGTDKTMILGTPYDQDAKPIPAGKYLYRVSLYGNHFNATHERNPRISHSIAHVYNNYYDHVADYAVSNDEGRAFVDRNVFAGAFTTGDAGTIRYLPTNTIGKNFTYRNETTSGSAVGSDVDGYDALRAKWVPAVVHESDSPRVSDFKNAGWN